MSSKPPKKSDRNKAWMNDRRDGRDGKRRLHPEYHLIVTEGTKTEPNYFAGLKQEINQKHRGRIDIKIEGEGDNTLSLLERAQGHVKRASNIVKHVWLVYDLDDFPHDDFDNTAHKCNSLSKSEESPMYHALWSNQCIELWFLLHFAYHQADVHRAGYKPILDRYISDLDSGVYEKNRDDIYKILRSKLKTAIANAKRLAEYHENLTPSQNAPGTSVYKIFEELSGYLE